MEHTKTRARVTVGFLFGCVLSALALFLTGAGHGTYAPLALNSSVRMFLPGIGVVLALGAAPLLWGAYYGLIPAIHQLKIRVVVTLAVCLIHIVPGAWLAWTDPAFHGAFQLMRLYLLAYLFIAAITVIGLVTVSRIFGERHDHVV